MVTTYEKKEDSPEQLSSGPIYANMYERDGQTYGSPVLDQSINAGGGIPPSESTTSGTRWDYTLDPYRYTTGDPIPTPPPPPPPPPPSLGRTDDYRHVNFADGRSSFESTNAYRGDITQWNFQDPAHMQDWANAFVGSMVANPGYLAFNPDIERTIDQGTGSELILDPNLADIYQWNGRNTPSQWYSANETAIAQNPTGAHVANVTDNNQALEELNSNLSRGEFDPATGTITPNSTINPAQFDTNNLSQSRLQAAQIENGSQINAPDDLQYQSGMSPDGSSVNQNTVDQRTNVQGEQLSPAQLLSQSIEAAKMEAARINAPDPRTISFNELTPGSYVDMQKVSEVSQIMAAAANPSKKATVAGQLETLMADFDGSEPPAWAAGAMREATARMQARGLGASSMAGMAIVQAAMESALPIATSDAAMWGQFEQINLSNQQQANVNNALTNKEMLGQKFREDFQAGQENANKQYSAAETTYRTGVETDRLNAQYQQEASQSNLGAETQRREAKASSLDQTQFANLSNRQQSALVAAGYRAQFLGQEFDQDYQAKVIKAAQISDIAQINFTADQQVALENSKLAQTTNLANLDAKQAKVLADAAALAQLDTANLSNAQQAAVENAKNFLAMDMTNLSNAQQSTMFKSQSIVNQILSDQAVRNSNDQLNATNLSETHRFNADLAARAAQFNATQYNAMREVYANNQLQMDMLNSEISNQRDMFNATNDLAIATANAQWYQQMAMTDTANLNEANRLAATYANEFTSQAYDSLMQRERDIMSFAFQSWENYQDRATNLILADKEIQANEDSQNSEGIGYLLGSLLFGF